jgi:predicted N-acetyltransferase YhbS
MIEATIVPLTKDRLEEAVNVVLNAHLDTKDEIEHHLQVLNAHFIALDNDQVIGVIGWYQDNVNYANEAMGDKFPGENAYWVGFFAVNEKYRGQGVGYSLIKKLEDVLITKGINELWVSSVPETSDYYERQGFEHFMDGKINGNSKVFMVKHLDK